ncbi:ataxin-8-like [Ceratitis capitata]|uniref:ataxin-8-like n=1 Tax=Ceratitis capitata TaxID=7213 RepID=UPI000C6C56E7|nr:ataxin-8-like [Ceratitis capitata]
MQGQQTTLATAATSAVTSAKNSFSKCNQHNFVLEQQHQQQQQQQQKRQQFQQQQQQQKRKLKQQQHPLKDNCTIYQKAEEAETQKQQDLSLATVSNNNYGIAAVQQQ